MEKQNVILGFDVGTNSIGWSIINETGDIIKTGVRLFNDVSTQKIGILRRQRRQNRRWKLRREDFINLLIKYKWIKDKKTFFDLFTQYHYSYNSIKTKLLQPQSDINLVIIGLFYFLHKRGYFYNNLLIPEETDYRKISHETHLQKLLEIFQIQNISIDFQNEFLSIFNRTRNFCDGPGYCSKWGIYTDKDNQQPHQYSYVWEKYIGQCAIYNKEKRYYKHSPYSELCILFEFLIKLQCDTNTIFIIISNINTNLNNDKLTIFHKKDLKNYKINSYLISKYIKNSHIVYCEVYQYLLLFLKRINQINHIDILNFDLLKQCDDLFNIIYTNYWNQSKLYDVLEKMYHINKNIIDDFIKNLPIITTFSKYSKKALIEYLQFCQNKDLNPMSLNDYFNKFKIYTSQKYLKLDTRNYYGQTLRILIQLKNLFNSLLKYINDSNLNLIHIGVENDNQLIQKEYINYIDLFQEKYNIDLKCKNELIRLKCKLWLHQNGQDLYNNTPINLNELLEHNEWYNIDHIIPISISKDNSFDNKILTSSFTNHQKGNKLPYDILTPSQWKIFEKQVLSNKYFTEIKKQKLLAQNYEVNNFLNRQLNFLNISNNVFFQILQNFITKNNYYPNVKISDIKSINVNYYFFKIFNQMKNRLDYSHNSYDASIISYLCWKYIYNIDILDKLKSNILTTKIDYSRQIIKKLNCQFVEDTIYRLINDNDKPMIQKKLDIFDKNITTIHKIFYENNIQECEKLIIFKKNKLLFNYLKDIYCSTYNKMLQAKISQKNPFLYYLQIMNLNDIIYNNNPVRKLKYNWYSPKNSDIIKYDYNTYSSCKIRPKTLNCRWYIDNNGIFKGVNINYLLLKNNNGNWFIDENKLASKLQHLNISKIHTYLNLFYGSILMKKDTKQLFYTVGSVRKENEVCYTIELKPLDKVNDHDHRKRLSLNSICDQFVYVLLDNLGDIKKIIDIKKFFKKSL